MGTATTDSFDRYELYYKPGDAGDEAYVYIGGAGDEVIDGQLGLWDVTQLEPGTYDLRMRVVRLDGNYSEHFAPGLLVSQTPEEPTATLTTTATLTPTVEVTATETVEPAATISPTATATATAEVSPTATVSPTPTTEIEEPSDLPAEEAQILVESNVNVRAGPGTNYAILSALQAGDRARITGQNEAGDWWQIEIDGASGWVLASLVTAENTADVPVIETPVPPPTPVPTPTPTPTPAAATGASSQVVVAEEAVSAAPLAGSGPVTVTLAGNDDEPDALRSFLRTLLVGFSPSNTIVTATIGVWPADFPLDLTVPATATVIGGVVRAGEFAGSQVYLAAEGAGDDLVATLRQQLLDGGFTTPPQETVGGPSAVFLSTDQFAPPLVLCGPDDETVVNLGTVLVAGEAEVVSVSSNLTFGLGGPCGEDPSGGGEMFGVLPSLAPPAQAQVRGSGGGSSSGPDSFSISAEAEIESTLTAADLAAHYEGQLEDEGWTRLDDSQTEVLAWSAWSFVDENGNEWNATFYIVRQGGEEGGFLATLRADTNP
jgi:uncharacterized protein YraI